MMEEDEIVEDEHDGIDASSEDADSDDGDDSSSSDESDDDEYDKVIKIPIQDSDEFVVFYTYELPDDVEEVLELLRGEVAPLEIWNKVSLAYYRARKHSQFAQILNEVCGNNEDDADILKHRYPENEENNREKVKMLNMLAAYHYQKAGDMAVADHEDDDTFERGDEQQAKHEALHMKMAMDLIRKAEAIDPNNSDLHNVTYINKAMFHFRRYAIQSAKGNGRGKRELEEAQKALAAPLHNLDPPLAKGLEVEWTHPAPGGSFYIVSRAVIESEVDGDNNVDIALLPLGRKPTIVNGISTKFLRVASDQGLGSEIASARATLLINAYLLSACIKFHSGAYKDAENLYKRVIIEDPGCPATVRVALGMCFYNRGRVQRAKMAFQRAIDMDERNEEALVALAIIERREGRENLAKARQERDSDQDYINELEKNLHRRVMDKFERVFEIGTERIAANETNHRHPVAVNNIARHRYLRLLWTEVGEGNDAATVRLTSGSDVVEVEGDFDFRNALKNADVIKIGGAIYRVDRSKGRGVTRREIPIARPYRGPNQHGQKVSVTNFEPAQQIMRLNSFALEQAARNGNHQVVGEGLHIEAVVNHAKGDMKRAREYYLQAHGRKYVRSYFGLAQTHMHFQNYDSALTVLNELNARVSNIEEVLLRLGMLHLLKGEHKQAMTHLKRVVELNDKNYFAWIGIAEVHQMQPNYADKEKARNAYQKAEIAWTEQGKPSAALYNNIGVLLFHLHKRKWAPREMLEAQQYFCKAMKRQKPRLDINEFSMPAACFENKELVLPVFNLARLKEEQGFYEEAKWMYNRILKNHKNFIECHLRQSEILLKAADPEAAKKELQQAVDKCQSWHFSGLTSMAQMRRWALRSSDAMTMRGVLQMKMGELENAKKTFDEIRTKSLTRIQEGGWKWGKHGNKAAVACDTYCVVALGNICWENREGETNFYMRSIKASKTHFTSVINNLDPGNLYAANGLGRIWAEECKFTAAKKLFKEIREGSSELIPDAWINLGHMYLYTNQPNLAVDIYTKCMNKFFDGQEPELLLYIANATYVAAMAARAKAQAAEERASSGIASADTLAMPVAHQFVECINTLSKLLQLTPENLHAWYCLAVALDEFGLSVEIRKAPSLAKDIEHYEEAVSSMLRAEKIYTWLSTQDSELVKARCGTPEERLDPCVENRQSAQDQLEQYQKAYAKQVADLEEQKAKQFKQMEAERAAREAAKTAEESRKQEEQERALAVAEQMKKNVQEWGQIEERMKQQEQLEQAQKRNRKKQPRAAGDGLPRSKKRSKKSTQSSDESEDPDVEEMFADSSDDEAGGGSDSGNEARPSGRLKKKSKDSDSESDSDIPGAVGDEDAGGGGPRKRPRSAMIDASDSDSEPGENVTALFGSDSDSDDDVYAKLANRADKEKNASGGDDGDKEAADDNVAALFGGDSDSDQDVLDKLANRVSKESKAGGDDDGGKGAGGGNVKPSTDADSDSGDDVLDKLANRMSKKKEADDEDDGDGTASGNVAALFGSDSDSDEDQVSKENEAGGDTADDKDTGDGDSEDDGDAGNAGGDADDAGDGDDDGEGEDEDGGVGDAGDERRVSKRPLSGEENSENDEEHQHKRKRVEGNI